MPDLTDFVSTSISASSATPQVPGFGKPLVLAQDTPAGFTNRYREYSSTAGAIADGFASTSATVTALGQIFAQNPRPPVAGVGRRANKTTQSIQFTLGSVTAGDVYSLTVVNTATGVATTVTRTSTGVPATDATAYAATIAAVTGFAASAASAVITVTASGGAGKIQQFKNWTVNGAPSTNFALFDNSSDPGIAADLNAIVAENTSWYGFSVDSKSKAEILAAAAWAETNKKLLVQQSSDSECIDSVSTTDVMYAVQSAAYQYTAIIYNGNDTFADAGLAWQAFRFASTPTPGSDTWSYNTLSSITPDVLTETQFAAVGTKNGTAYVSVDGVNYTAAGSVANSKSGGKTGSGVFLDTRRFRDWQLSDINLSVYVAIAPGTGKRVPYTNKGIALIEGAVLGSLKRGETNGGNVVGASQVSAPDVSAISATDKSNRVLSGLTFETEDTGGIHLVTITGSVLT